MHSSLGKLPGHEGDVVLLEEVDELLGVGQLEVGLQGLQGRELAQEGKLVLGTLGDVLKKTGLELIDNLCEYHMLLLRLSRQLVSR